MLRGLFGSLFHHAQDPDGASPTNPSSVGIESSVGIDPVVSGDSSVSGDSVAAMNAGAESDRRGDVATDSARRVVLYAHVPNPPPPRHTAGRDRWGQDERAAEPSHSTGSRATESRPTLGRSGSVDHREWLLSMQLSHLKICSASRCRLLATAGIHTAADLIAADPEAVCRRIGVNRGAIKTLYRYRSAIDLATRIADMMPRDAMLLFAVYRKTPEAIAADSAIGLHRDLQRFAMCSRGQKMLRGRRLPSVKRIRKWIACCQRVSAPSAETTSRPASTRAAGAHPTHEHSTHEPSAPRRKPGRIPALVAGE